MKTIKTIIHSLLIIACFMSSTQAMKRQNPEQKKQTQQNSEATNPNKRQRTGTFKKTIGKTIIAALPIALPTAYAYLQGTPDLGLFLTALVGVGMNYGFQSLLTPDPIVTTETKIITERITEKAEYPRNNREINSDIAITINTINTTYNKMIKVLKELISLQEALQALEIDITADREAVEATQALIQDKNEEFLSLDKEMNTFKASLNELFESKKANINEYKNETIRSANREQLAAIGDAELIKRITEKKRGRLQEHDQDLVAVDGEIKAHNLEITPKIGTINTLMTKFESMKKSQQVPQAREKSPSPTRGTTSNSPSSTPSTPNSASGNKLDSPLQKNTSPKNTPLQSAAQDAMSEESEEEALNQFAHNKGNHQPPEYSPHQNTEMEEENKDTATGDNQTNHQSTISISGQNTELAEEFQGKQ